MAQVKNKSTGKSIIRKVKIADAKIVEPDIEPEKIAISNNGNLGGIIDGKDGNSGKDDNDKLKQGLVDFLKEFKAGGGKPDSGKPDSKEDNKPGFDYYNLTFDVIDAILHQHNKRELVNHQHASYKQFIEKDLGDIIRQFNTRKLYFNYDPNANKHKLELHIDFLNYNLGRPTIHENDGSFKVMRPDIAKLRNLTYSAPLSLNVKLTRILRSSSNPEIGVNPDGTQTIIETYDQEDIREEIFNNINFGRIPIMVMGANCMLNKPDDTTLEMNGECPYDMGGYFIIGGNEKVIISQERIAENEPFVFNNQKKIKGKEIEIRCVSDQHFSIVVANMIRYVFRDCSLEMEIPSFKAPVPIFLIMKALGVPTDKKLFEYIAWDVESEHGTVIMDNLKSSFDRFLKICRAHNIETNAPIERFQEILITYLKFKNVNKDIRLSPTDKMEYLYKILDDEILPHIGTSADKKAKYLGYMCRKLILVQFDYVPHDDRDAYDNKRVDTPGRLCAIQFRQCFNKVVKDMVKSITREIKNNKSRRDVFELITNNNIYKIIKPTIIDGGMKYALATGNWGVKTTGKGNIKAGTAQVLNRLSYQSFVSHLRRVNSPSDKTGNNGKIVKPRKLHGSGWGYLCPAETPEGQPVGLVKNLALTAKITCNSNSVAVRAILATLDIKPIEDANPKEINKACSVFVNGDWLGITINPESIVKRMRAERRQANINIYTGIHWNIEQKYIRISTDAGRLTRPMYIVDEDNHLRITNDFAAKMKECDAAFNFLISPKFYEMTAKTGTGNLLTGVDYGSEGVIEYIDTNEVNNAYFAMTIDDLMEVKIPYINKFTHCEIFPGLILGAVASLIPFPDDNQSPRNCYQCLLPDEPVLMADGSYKTLQDIKLADEVMTFNPQNYELSSSPVINYFVRPALHNEKGYKITTIDGDEIVATGNHKFMTKNGWEQVRFMIPANPEQPQPSNKQKFRPTKIGIMKPDGTARFVKIDTIELVDMPMVADITVESENHSFIAGNAGFMSSNCAMGKQSIGLYARNFQKRMDTLGYVMNNLEKALVRTRFSKYINYDELPCGVNAMVAIGCYTGYNMEDSVLLNKAAIDRGLFRATFYRTYKDDEKKIQSSGREEKFAKPNAKYTRGTKPGNYNKLDERGFVRKDEYVSSDDIIIGKVLPLKNKTDENGHQLYKDCSTSLRSNETGFVDKIYTDRNADGFRFVKIRMRTERIPVIGDKFASRCAQKGTVGMIFPQEQMPFNADGISPDIIMNPHAIPSRMTIGMLMELILGKTSAHLAGYSDCTPFCNISYDKICDVLEANGFNYTGDEILYSGIDGKQLDVKIFFGPTYYQRLKHMVADKAHVRSSGPVVQLTRQPAEGRSRDGGLRFGEMERDCVVWGASITVNCGLSFKIEDFNDKQIQVLGWNSEKNGMKTAKQTAFMYKGERECVDIYLEDGRKISCTPEHKLLTDNKEWVMAKDLKPGETRLKASVKYPTIGINDELLECNKWSYKICGELILKTDTLEEYFKSMAFARILGYILADGSISKRKSGHYEGLIYIGHQIDLANILADLKLFTTIKQTNFIHKNLYEIRLPATFTKILVQIKGIMTGARVKQATTLPEFLLADNCPLPIIREFIAGLFGGDGHTCNISKNTFTYVSFSQSKIKPHLDSLTSMMEQIKTWLAKFGITGVSLQQPKINSASKKRVDEDKKNYEIVLHLDMNELIPFYEKIGFRYCCHKNQRLEAAVAYTRLRTGVIRQKHWIINRVNEITNYKTKKNKQIEKITEGEKNKSSKSIPLSKAIKQATEELRAQEPILHDFAIPTNADLKEYLLNNREGGKIPSSKFPTSSEFLKSIDAYCWFKNPKDINQDVNLESGCYGVMKAGEVLPTMNLKVLDVRPGGVHPVYDIQVENEESFLANGVVAHNCMITHGAMGFLKERMMDVSDKFTVYICQECGLFSIVDPEEDGERKCDGCNNYSQFMKLNIPYACKLLMQELEGMMITPRFNQVKPAI